MKTPLILIILVCFSSCKSAKFYHDAQNPCGPDPMFKDSVACDQWKKDFPKEHALYLERPKP